MARCVDQLACARSLGRLRTWKERAHLMIAQDKPPSGGGLTSVGQWWKYRAARIQPGLMNKVTHAAQLSTGLDNQCFISTPVIQHPKFSGPLSNSNPAVAEFSRMIFMNHDPPASCAAAHCSWTPTPPAAQRPPAPCCGTSSPTRLCRGRGRQDQEISQGLPPSTDKSNSHSLSSVVR